MRCLVMLTALAAVTGCSKDADPTPDAIIETGYVECMMPGEGCDGLTTCTDDVGAEICVQAQPDVCNDALTCDCVGAWLCGDLACADAPDGITCGEPEAPPPEEQCLQVDGMIDAGERLIFDPAQVILAVRATCAAEVTSVDLLPSSAVGTGLRGTPVGATLNAGEFLEYVVEFAPPADPGVQTATVRVNDDPALDTVVRVEFVRPAGGPCIQPSPAQLDFGRVPLGQQNDQQITFMAGCGGELTASAAIEPTDAADIEVLGTGPVEAGDRVELFVRVAPRLPAPFSGTVTLEGLGAPVEIAISGDATDSGPPCDAGMRCPDGMICSALDECVAPIEFVLELDDGARETWVQMPRGRYFEAVRIAPAERPEEIMIPFMPCDACDAAPDCAQQPERVGRIGQIAPFEWDGVRWRTDTIGDDCSRPVAMEPGDYLAIFCVSDAVELGSAVDPETGTALGRIQNESCLPPVPFSWPADRRIVGLVPGVN